MGFTTVPDKATGDVFTEAMWDQIKDNFNTGVPVLLGNTTLGSPAASIDFTSISQSWAHLLLLAYLRGTTAATFTTVGLRYNGDAGANYDYQHVGGSAATASASEAFAATSALIASCPASTATASVFGALVLEVPFYSQGTNNKSATSMFGNKIGTATANMDCGGRGLFWRSNAAITQVTLLPGAGNFETGSRATLYGMP